MRYLYSKKATEPLGREKQLASPSVVQQYWDTFGGYKLGDFFYTEVGAPGVGFHKYLVTRNDSTGLWGRLVEADVKELEEWDVI